MLKNGFRALNIVQFIDALNENLFKLLVIFFLIHLEGEQSTANITTLVGGLFVLPFIIFSSLGGVCGDRWSKTSVIRITRLLQVAVTLIAVIFVAFNLKIPTYILFILMATLGALFGPSKYGIIAELSGPKDMMKANSYVAAFTLFGIIFGTFLASVLDTIFVTHFAWMFVFCFLLALLGTYFSFKIPMLDAANPDKEKCLFVYRELYQSFLAMRKKRLMLLALFAYSYFFFFGAFIQINIIPFSVQILHMDPNIGGYLFVFSAAGMGIGSLAASRMKQTLNLLAPFTALSSIFCFLFWLLPLPYWTNAIWLLVLGIAAGIFVVPAQAFLVSKSEPEDRARNFGTANFASFIFCLLAAIILYIFNDVFDFNAAENFNALAWINLFVAAFLYWKTRNGKNGSAASNNQ